MVSIFHFNMVIYSFH